MELESILLPGVEEKRPMVIAGPRSAETEAQVPKDRAAAKKAISGGFRLTVFQTLVCVLILLAAFFLRGFLPELYGELRAKYDAELNRSVLILQDDVPYS